MSTSSSTSGASSSSTPLCPAHGDFCGSDGVQGGDADTLYLCPGAGAAPASATPCASGCSAQPARVPDFCVGTAAVCPGNGAFCGSDGVHNGAANTLYQCPGAGQAPSASQACAQGCDVRPAGTPDVCTGSTPVCPGLGDYCGADGVQGGDPNTLYHCSGAGSAPTSASACGAGCSVQPAGTNDRCQVVCPGNGAFCGSDGVTGGDPNTLYECPGAGQAPSSAQSCGAGCSVQPAGTPDVCSGSCGGAAGSALAYEAGKIQAGQGGACNGGPPSCYSEYCLGFVIDAYDNAGDSVPGLRAYAAVDSMHNEQSRGNWTAWAGSCPCGAILYWDANSCNGGFGHVVICNGDGTVSTSGWSNYGGGTHASISWLRGEECGHDPAGFAMP